MHGHNKEHNKISSKTQCSFIQIDIESFCPSITRELMNKAIDFAKTIADIPDEDLPVTLQSLKRLYLSLKKKCHE